MRRIADHLAAADVRLPDGDRLTAERFRLLGGVFGMSYGYAQIHWLLEEAWHAEQLADTFRYEVMARTGFVDQPLYALQEYSYGQANGPTDWAAARALENHPAFAAGADPLLFTGEMMYPWMFEQIAALRPFAGAADILAAASDWPILYDRDRLAANEVPVIAAVYADDMYVDVGLSLETAAAVGNLRAWVTNEHQHDGLRTSGDVVLAHLMDMASALR